MAIKLVNPQLRALTATTERKTYTVAFGTILVVVLLVFFAIRPAIATVFDRLAQNEKRQEQLDNMDQKYQHLITLSSQEAARADALGLLDIAIPSVRSEDWVADELKALADQNSLVFNSMSVEIIDGKSNIQSELGSNTEFADVNLSVTGERENFLKYLSDIETTIRPLNIYKVAISSRIDSTGEYTDSVDATLYLEIYYYTQQ